MRRVTALFVAVLVVVATVPAGVAAAGSQATATQTSAPTTETTETVTANATTETDANETTETDDSSDANESEMTPGERFAGVLAVQQAEIDGELESRSFGQRVAEAASNESKARVVADQLNESRERLETLRERRSELEAARESGNVSRGRYRAEAARLTAEIRSLERLLNQSSDAARELPEETKRANGIDSEEVDRLRTEARNLSGDEVSDIAKEIAGPGVGNGLADEDEKKRGNGRDDAPGRSGERGPPSADDSDRGPDADVPGLNATAANATENESTEDAPGRSGDAPGRSDEGANGTDDGDGGDIHVPPGRENGTVGNGQNGSDDDNDRRGDDSGNGSGNGNGSGVDDGDGGGE